MQHVRMYPCAYVCIHACILMSSDLSQISPWADVGYSFMINSSNISYVAYLQLNDGVELF